MSDFELGKLLAAVHCVSWSYVETGLNKHIQKDAVSGINYF